MNRHAAALFAGCLSLATAGCAAQPQSTPFASAPLVVGQLSVGRAAAPATTGSGSSLAGWILGAQDYCPSKAGSIKLNLLAENQSGQLINGSFGTTIVLANSDTSGATHLSTTKASSSGQAIALTYTGKAVPPLRISATALDSTATMVIAPGSKCVNATPDVVVVADTSATSSIALAGQGTTPPLELGTSTTGANGWACGQDVALTQTGAATFGIRSRLGGWGKPCFVYAAANAQNVVTAQSVLIVK